MCRDVSCPTQAREPAEMPGPAAAAPPAHFTSILYPGGDSPAAEISAAPECFRDLNLDQIVHAITAPWREYDLAPFFHAPLQCLDAIAYRQEIMRDIEVPAVTECVNSFSRQMRAMRASLQGAQNSRYPWESERLGLNAAGLFCDAVDGLRKGLDAPAVNSRGLRGLREHVARCCQSAPFRALQTEAAKLTSDLAAIRYNLLLGNGSVTVRPCAGEIDYTAAVEQTFAKFRHAPAKDYSARLPDHTGMNHIQAHVLEGVAGIYPGVFRDLHAFAARHPDYSDPVIVRFDREIQFYAAYLAYLQKFRGAGLDISYPRVSQDSRELCCRNSFDLALAAKCIDEKRPVVTNDFMLRGAERMLVVSGPNQGGKTTFARTFGQLHYLAALGCPIPGSETRLFLCDRIFTHFEREEDIRNLRGKLQDDLVRIHEILDRATPRGIVIMNELFQSTTLQDAVFLSKKIMAAIAGKGLLGVWVTFLTELAAFNEQTVSIVSQVDPRDPAIRTFKLEPRPAEGLAYALAVAEKYGLTRERVKQRLQERHP